eukprot:8388489-Pyramimonas_sp.AAC.1
MRGRNDMRRYYSHRSLCREQGRVEYTASHSSAMVRSGQAERFATCIFAEWPSLGTPPCGFHPCGRLLPLQNPPHRNHQGGRKEANQKEETDGLGGATKGGEASDRRR